MSRTNIPESQNLSRLSGWLLPIFTIFIFSIYLMTAHRTITWWHGCSYSITAITFGIDFPPGSIILTILGWLVSQLPLGISKAFTLNLFAGALGTCACIITALIVLKLTRRHQITDEHSQNRICRTLVVTAVASGCLTLAFSETTWLYATQFTPYILTMAFTTILLWAISGWWEQEDVKTNNLRLLVIMLLFGLDFSVHRTNLLLLPGFFVWILICRPKVIGQIKSWLYGVTGLIIGLAFHLVIIPISASDPIMNANDPSNWQRFYDYISLKQFGGGWLVNLFPRKGPFWDVQLADYLDAFGNNFISSGGILAVVPIVLCLIGLIMLWRQHWKYASGMLIFFLCTSLGAVIYFNLPKNFFWPMDRHYLPSFVIFTIFVAYGASSIFSYIWNNVTRYKALIISPVFLLVLSMPVKQIIRNYNQMDSSNKYFAYDYASNILKTLQPDAILFVEGDNFWPLFYLRTVEGVRTDVTVLSPSLSNTRWYLRQILSRNPDFPVTFTEEELQNFGLTLWQDTTIATVVNGTFESFQLPDSVLLPDTFYIELQPNIADRYIMGLDLLLVKLIQENRWRRPIYFTSPPAWLARYSRPEGYVWRLVPQESAEPNIALLRENLLQKYNYRGFADPGVAIDKFTRVAALVLYRQFLGLAQYEIGRGNAEAGKQVLHKLNELLPVDRIDPPPQLRQMSEQLSQME